MSRALEEACVNAGIPYKIVGGFSFYERAEIKDCLSMLKLFVNDRDVVAFSRVAGLLDGNWTKGHQVNRGVFFQRKDRSYSGVR